MIERPYYPEGPFSSMGITPFVLELSPIHMYNAGLIRIRPVQRVFRQAPRDTPHA